MAKTDKKTVLSVLNIGARLLVICLAVAAVVSLVNEVTKARYAELQLREQRNSMASIFGATDIAVAELGDNVYQVRQGEDILGYCVQVVTAGFGGDMTLMVGFGSDRSIAGVQILSHSETPGLGAKASDAAYLAQYQGKSGTLSLGEDIDAVSGATISSRAVLSGVTKAQEILDSHLAKGGDAQ